MSVDVAQKHVKADGFLLHLLLPSKNNTYLLIVSTSKTSFCLRAILLTAIEIFLVTKVSPLIGDSWLNRIPDEACRP